MFYNFLQQANFKNLTVRGKVVSTHLEHEIFYSTTKQVKFEISKKYSGKTVNSLITIESYSSTCDRLDIGTFTVGQEYFINLYQVNNNWRVVSCGESWIRIHTDSLAENHSGISSADSLEFLLEKEIAYPDTTLNQVSNLIYYSQSYRIGKSDTFHLKRLDLDGHLIFQGDSINGILIGEHWDYYKTRIRNFKTDERGIQGNYISYDTLTKSKYIMPFLNNKREGKAYFYSSTYSKKKFLSKRWKHITTKEPYLSTTVEYKNNLLHGESCRYSGKHISKKDLYHNGKFKKCIVGCYESEF